LNETASIATFYTINHLWVQNMSHEAYVYRSFTNNYLRPTFGFNKSIKT